MSLDGFYAGYMTAVGGSGVALFVLREGTLVGADMGGVQFDGNYVLGQHGDYSGSVVVKVPAGVTVIQGVTAPPSGLSYEVALRLPENFVNEPFFEITTPLGKVNARLQKIRDMA